MPELPEVETVRRGLQERVVGRTITAVEVGRERTVRRTSSDEVINRLTGTSITAAGRRGKYLVCPLDSGDAVMIHLRMSGQVLIADRGVPRPKHTHVVAHLAEIRDVAPQELWFVDPRTFGEVVVFDPAMVERDLPELAKLGVDPLTDGLDARLLKQLMAGRSRQLKSFLLDQHVIAGLGNIYADEVLHRARIHPLRTTDQLTSAEIARLASAIRDILTAAVAAGGSTLGDAQYVDLMGSGGSYQDDHCVYGRTGERCTTCDRGFIRRLIINSRSSHFCPVCQR